MGSTMQIQGISSMLSPFNFIVLPQFCARIFPAGIGLFDEIDLLLPPPRFDLFFPIDHHDHFVTPGVVNQTIASIDF